MEITDEDIRNLIKSFVSHKNKEIISKVLAEAIGKTDNGKIILFKAVCGSSITPDFTQDQMVLFNYKYARSWNVNEEQSLSKNLFINRYDTILARSRVLDVDRLSSYPIKVQFSFIDSDGNRIDDTAWLKEKHVILDSDFHNSVFEIEKNREYIERAGMKYCYIDDKILGNTTVVDEEINPF